MNKLSKEDIESLLLKSGKAGWSQTGGASIWVDDAAEIIAEALNNE
jgi:hypothetical protein